MAANYRQNRFVLDASNNQPSQGDHEVRGVGGKFWAYADDFMGELEGPHTLNSGSDPQAVDAVRDTAQPGGVIQLVSGDADGTFGTDGSQIVLSSCPIQLDAAAQPIEVEARVRIVSAVTTCSVFFGLTDVTTIEEPFSNSADTITSNASDAVGFLYDTDATTDRWWMVAVDTDTDDAGNAALPASSVPVADTWQVLKMVIAGDGAQIVFYIDGEPVGTLAGDGVGDDVPLYATLTVCSTTTTSRTLECDWIRLSGERES